MGAKKRIETVGVNKVPCDQQERPMPQMDDWIGTQDYKSEAVDHAELRVAHTGLEGRVGHGR